jgi:hypothetical protein
LEYGETFEYLPGEKNVVADAFSLLDINDLRIQEEEKLALVSESERSNIQFLIVRRNNEKCKD